MSLNGRTALVTGASRGIGRAIARRLAKEGARVAVNYLARAGEADAVARQIREDGGQALAVQADVADAAQVSAMVERVASELGPIDILVNNAGIIRRGDLREFDAGAFHGMTQTNIIGLVHVTRAAVPGMQQRGFGRIVNVASIAAHGTSLPGTTFYAATKAAVCLLTRRFALELGPYGITVNAVAPGFIVTDMVREGRTEEEAQLLIETLAAAAMTRRVGHPDDIAHAVAFLASPDSGFITAQVLTVDGGRTDYIAHP